MAAAATEQALIGYYPPVGLLTDRQTRVPLWHAIVASNAQRAYPRTACSSVEDGSAVEDPCFVRWRVAISAARMVVVCLLSAGIPRR
jgi:hypothetical protein